MNTLDPNASPISASNSPSIRTLILFTLAGSLPPFLWAMFANVEGSRVWWLLFSVFLALNWVLLIKTVAGLIDLMSDRGSLKRIPKWKVFLLATLKVAALMGSLALLWSRPLPFPDTGILFITAAVLFPLIGLGVGIFYVRKCWSTQSTRILVDPTS